MHTGHATLGWRLGLVGLIATLVGGCSSQQPITPTVQRPDVSPDGTVVAAALALTSEDIDPMYTEMLAIDLPSVVKVVLAQNIDVQQARLAVVASRGEYESAVGAVFPAIVPTALFEHVEGTVRATEGDLVGVGFNTFQPSMAVQWVINPGRVIYDILAARKRLASSADREEAIILDTMRAAVVQYYDLILAQARVSAAHQSAAEAEELLRINRLRADTGTGVTADVLRAEARLSGRRQDLITAMMGFYETSVRLSVTLHLDSSVTLVPDVEELPPICLVRDDLAIDDLLDIAVAFRPDLASVRKLVEAAAAERGATWWGAFGPQFETSYQYGGIIGDAKGVRPNEGLPGLVIVNPASPNGSFSPNPVINGLIRDGIRRGTQRAAGRDDQTFGLSDQQRVSAGVGWRLSLSAFGDLKAAGARTQQARMEATRQVDVVRAQVVTASQFSKANKNLIDLAGQQTEAAAEAHRLAEANLRVGTMTTLDVLQTQDSVNRARLRHAEAVVRYNQAQVNLLAALGLLNRDALSMHETTVALEGSGPAHAGG
jgi:outer membrane protein TolC